MKRPSIIVHDRQRRLTIDRGDLQSFAERALDCCRRQKSSGLAELSEIDVIVVSDRRMAQLHRRFMGIDGPTDVITFQHGEIFLSVETAKRQAASYRTSLRHEMRLYLVHGLLHLAGYDDRKPAERRRMERVQEKIVALAAG
jgi:probable rRNA maturation factor